MLLENVNSVDDLRKLKIEELDILSSEIREYIIDVVSENGGHLAPNLGVTELTIALHYAFNTPEDKLIWDVGHQCYTHKILTERKNSFRTLRQYKGLSGFPRRSESIFDTYDTGHSSTSLSLALGDSVARDLSGKQYKIIPIIGDGAMTGGIAFEALNQIGHLKKDIIIILNDNEHSISKNVGALSESLTRIITSQMYNNFKKKFSKILLKLPLFGKPLTDFFLRTEGTVKGMLIPGIFFEELGIRYFGPIDGHNIKGLVEFFDRIKKINSGPKIVHVITKKGKGFKPSEKRPDIFHGISSFSKFDGTVSNKNKLSYSDVVGKTLCHLASKDDKIIAITAAMTLGTGLEEYANIYPKRFFDVGIAEQHALTFASSLAANKYKPFVVLYSTFLQRGIDQIIHDIAIPSFPVKILIDRAGLVGADGETHQGLFDISLLKGIPNLIFLSPANGEELRDAVYFAANYNDGPIAIRYPRGSIEHSNFHYNEHNQIESGKIKICKDGQDILIIAVGDMVSHSMKIADILNKQDIHPGIVNLFSITPLDVFGLNRIIAEYPYFITIENGYITNGIGEKIVSEINHENRNKFLFSCGFPQKYIEHGTINELFDQYEISPDKIAKRIETLIKQNEFKDQIR